ncbi:MAG TPA: ribonuclease R, partial [Chitinophagaceae bacterium]|nr:ribonuclease R [Chitinophagaceae bacterium]
EYDDFRHVESDYALVGRRSGRVFRMGDKVWVKVISTNLAKRQIDFEWVITSTLKNDGQASLIEEPNKEEQPSKPKKKKKSKKG